MPSAEYTELISLPPKDQNRVDTEISEVFAIGIVCWYSDRTSGLPFTVGFISSIAASISSVFAT